MSRERASKRWTNLNAAALEEIEKLVAVVSSDTLPVESKRARMLMLLASATQKLDHRDQRGIGKKAA